MLEGNDKGNNRYRSCSTTCYKHDAIAALPVQPVPGYDGKTKEHGYQTTEESGLHGWNVADLFDAHIHHGEEERGSQHMQDTLIDLDGA